MCQNSVSAPDQRLIAEFLAGDEAAVLCIQGWLEQGSQPFRRRLHWQWEDLRQDLLLEVTRLLRSGTFKGKSSVRTYVWRIADQKRFHTDIEEVTGRGVRVSD